MQALSLFLLAAYYKILNGFPFVAVGALLLYVGAYQVRASVLYKEPDNQNNLFLQESTSLLFAFVFQVSFGPISWLMVSEIFPLRTRGRGISLAVLTNFGSNALVTFAFSPLKVLLLIVATSCSIS
jgi:hypothetical protein